MTPDQQEAQRALERKALQNVRSLVDRLEAEDDANRRHLIWAGIVMLVAFGLLVLMMALKGPKGTAVIATSTRAVPAESSRVKEISELEAEIAAGRSRLAQDDARSAARFAFDGYVHECVRRITDAANASGAPEVGKSRSVRLKIRIGLDGSLVEAQVIESSGPEFAEFMLRSVQAAAPFARPPAAARARGGVVEFTKTFKAGLPYDPPSSVASIAAGRAASS